MVFRHSFHLRVAFVVVVVSVGLLSRFENVQPLKYRSCCSVFYIIGFVVVVVAFVVVVVAFVVVVVAFVVVMVAFVVVVVFCWIIVQV